MEETKTVAAAGAGCACVEAPAEVAGTELAALNDGRAATYALLARLYRGEVDAAYLETLRHAKYPVDTGNAQADEGYRLIATYLSGAWEGTLGDLARDFARCFMGQGKNAHSAAYPYESVYTSKKRLLMQDARDEVLALLKSEGFAKSEGWKETEDHVSVELEFMQVLASRTAAALRAGDEDRAERLLATQRNFVQDHLAPWIRLFTDDVRTYARTGFYRGLACLTDGFLQTDREFLDEALGAGEGRQEPPA